VTASFGDGFHAFATPVVASIAARSLRNAPPTYEK
jgi:hypothetical protein